MQIQKIGNVILKIHHVDLELDEKTIVNCSELARKELRRYVIENDIKGRLDIWFHNRLSSERVTCKLRLTDDRTRDVVSTSFTHEDVEKSLELALTPLKRLSCRLRTHRPIGESIWYT